jgi:hypothetical protein
VRYIGDRREAQRYEQRNDDADGRASRLVFFVLVQKDAARTKSASDSLLYQFSNSRLRRLINSGNKTTKTQERQQQQQQHDCLVVHLIELRFQCIEIRTQLRTHKTKKRFEFEKETLKHNKRRTQNKKSQSKSTNLRCCVGYLLLAKHTTSHTRKTNAQIVANNHDRYQSRVFCIDDKSCCLTLADTTTKTTAFVYEQ